MKNETKYTLVFLAGVVITVMFNYVMKQKHEEQTRMLITACQDVWIDYQNPTIITINGYWEIDGHVCVVYENGRFRDLTDEEFDTFSFSYNNQVENYVSRKKRY